MEIYGSARSLEISYRDRSPRKRGTEPYPNYMLLITLGGMGMKEFVSLILIWLGWG